MSDPASPAPAAAGSASLGPTDLTVAIPTLNPGRDARALLDGLAAQAPPIGMDQVVILDSESADAGIGLFREAGCRVQTVPRREFNHGGTRNLGLHAASTEIVLFLTQDAIPTDPNLLAAILRPFADPKVAMAYGRQLPRAVAGPIETHARLFNYPDADRIEAPAASYPRGIKTVFNSNSCAAYRRAALLAVGGFPTDIIMGEDTVAAARLLQAGWTLAYASGARVSHSHGYTLREEFNRYFDIGVFHDQFRDVLAPYGGANSEGRRFVLSELRHLAGRAPWLVPEAMLRTASKLIGYRLGRRHAALPAALNRRLAMHKGFFASR